MEIDGASVSSPSCSIVFGIPTADRVEFGDLPPDVQNGVLVRLRQMQTIHFARRKQTACKASAALSASGKHPIGWQRLRALYYQFADSGDWRVLLDKRKAPKGDDGAQLSPRFLDFVKTLHERNQRKFAPAHAELINIWRTHHRVAPNGKLVHVKEIPGYSSWPVAEPDTDLPAGWTYANLQKKVARDKFATAATKEGRTAAAAFRPQVPTTREFLKIGQRVFMDDQWYDVDVNFLGVSRRALRPLGLDMLDHCSGCFTAHGFRPRLREEATGINRSIKVEETSWLVIHHLTNVGFRTDGTGTIIVHEHGTANIPQALKDAITQITEGMVTFDASGLQGDPAFAGQFEGQSKGNFKYKAPLESAYNLVRNFQAALPGATGHDRNPPEQLFGLKKYNQRLLEAYDALEPERRKLLKFPLLNWHDFIFVALHFYNAIDTRTEHDLQGWQRLGFMAYEYRLATDAPWRPMEELAMFPVEQSAAIHALLNSQPHLTRNRYLSPSEVWNAHKHELTRLPDSVVGALLPGEANLATVTDEGYFRLKDQELDPESILYLAQLNGDMLPRGREYFVLQNAFQPDRLIVHDKCHNGKIGGYLGSAKLWGREDVRDTAAIQRRCGQVQKLEADLLAPVARRGREITEAKAAMHDHNAAVLAGFNTPEDRLKAERSDKDLMEQATAALLKNAKHYDTEEQP